MRFATFTAVLLTLLGNQLAAQSDADYITVSGISIGGHVTGPTLLWHDSMPRVGSAPLPDNPSPNSPIIVPRVGVGWGAGLSFRHSFAEFFYRADLGYRRTVGAYHVDSFAAKVLLPPNDIGHHGTRDEHHFTLSSVALDLRVGKGFYWTVDDLDDGPEPTVPVESRRQNGVVVTAGLQGFWHASGNVRRDVTLMPDDPGPIVPPDSSHPLEGSRSYLLYDEAIPDLNPLQLVTSVGIGFDYSFGSHRLMSVEVIGFQSLTPTAGETWTYRGIELRTTFLLRP